MTSALSAERLSVRVPGGDLLLAPVSFAVPEATTLVIMGETGAGKSLLAQAIMGALPPPLIASGSIVVGSERVDTMQRVEREALWGHRLAMLPQEPWRALDPLMRAGRQVFETHRLVAGRRRQDARRQTRADFDSLGLGDAAAKLPGALSGGMAQRVAFAAARAGGASIVLADEPTKGLDASRRDRVVELLTQIPRNGGTLLAITHDVEVARRLGGEVMVLKDGKLVEQGATSDVLRTPRADYTKALLAAAPSAWPKVRPAAAGDMALHASGLALERGGKRLFDDVDLAVHRRERVAVTGPSGSGKTSLLDLLAGLVAPLRGEVRRGESLKATSVQKLYQDPPAAFAPRVVLGKSLNDVLRRHGIERAVLDALLRRLGIGGALLERRPDAVSGGELQRIALARVLAISPAVLLADEPTSRLDPVTQASTMALLGEVAEEQDLALVLVTHDEAIAARWAHRRLGLAVEVGG